METHEPKTAAELFFSRMLEDIKNSTSKKVAEDVKKIRELMLDRRQNDIEVEKDRRKKDRGRGLWQAFWKAAGVLKADGDKLFKD